ncbi:TPA: DUF2254 domain-containing protein [Escherichia coli]|nr:DUF2254 domain-containing protein [Escherichia coli]EFL4453728.1 DUF2254 domain-containing protein [Escherichia coli]EHB7710403.1 DUF2254 domain-containing protein [Escherichia coli]EHC5048011.1 DUF2254 domain-containing protein [Escherichia coli]EHY3370337.1 hypothetical protein [Escherichia coli]
MISRWKWMLKQTIKKLWFRATLFAIVAIITALLSILFKSMIPESVSVKVGAEAVDNILNILALKWSTKTGHRVRVFPVSIFRFVWG